MTNQEWEEKCKAKWQELAGSLISDGYEQQNLPSLILPAIFVKDGQALYLARRLGSTTWYIQKFSKITKITQVEIQEGDLILL